MSSSRNAASLRRRGKWPPPPGATVNDVIPVFLVDIDQMLAEANTELHARPMKAASIIVKHYLVKIHGDTKDEYYKKPWFASIFGTVYEWYEVKYGANFNHTPGFPAIVAIHDFPYLVEVALTHSVPGDEPDTTWLSFEVTLGNEEAPRQWIKDPPNLSALSKRQGARLDRELSRLTEQIRRIHIYFMTASRGGKTFDELRNVSILSLRNAAQQIRTNSAHSLALAMWEINYALENAMKALIDQAGGAFPRVHDLEALLREAAAVGIRPFPKSALAFMPTSKEVIKHRYGEPVAGGLPEVLRAYRLGLDRLVRIGALMERTIRTEHARVLLQRPPWLTHLLEAKKARAAPT